MTEDRRPVVPVRQLSLQQTTPSRQQVIRRRSTDDEKSLQSLTTSIARGKVIGNGKPPASRPKVRMAWTEAQRKTDKQLEKVEVVAHQIPGRSRSNTGRYRPFSGNEKASILYSRQQLAERLRLAWKHRQENKANIDIFLAHNVREERSDSALSTFTASSTPRQEKAISVFDDEENDGDLGRDQLDGECKLENKVDDLFIADEFSDLSGNRIQPLDGADIKLDSPVNQKKNILEKNDSSNTTAKQKRASFRSGTNKAFLTIEKSEASQEMSIKSVISKNINAKNTKDLKMSLTDFPRNEKFRDVSTMDNAPQGSSSYSQNVPPKIPLDHKDNSQTDKLIKKNNQYSKTVTPRRNHQTTRSMDQRSRRTNSAPPTRNLENASNRVQVNIVIDTASTGKSLEKSHINNSDHTNQCHEKETRIEQFDSSISKISISRPTRSAPLKRRSKSTKRRLFSGLSKGDDDANHSSLRKNAVDSKTIDLVTMVSLVSSADSDSDIENSPRDDNLINELRSKLPTTPIIKASINSVGLRRVIKSVSFQNDSFDEETASVNLEPPKEEKRNNQTRFALANEKPVVPQSCSDTVIVVPKETIPSLLLGNDENSSDVQLTDREKRCLAVPIGDLNDKKRKLLKTRSTPSRPILERKAVSVDLKGQDTLNSARIRPLTPLLPDKTTLESFSTQIERPVITQKEPDDEIPLEICEPHFQTPKEKECWQLYRRMCDKGVCVSFDTVLRGMLTPTEYRLRQRELQNF